MDAGQAALRPPGGGRDYRVRRRAYAAIFGSRSLEAAFRAKKPMRKTPVNVRVFGLAAGMYRRAQTPARSRAAEDGPRWERASRNSR